jgi:hypothetical protein
MDQPGDQHTDQPGDQHQDQPGDQRPPQSEWLRRRRRRP